MTTKRIVLSNLVASLLVTVGVGACGGHSAPAHTGYPTNVTEPWTKAKRLSLDDNFEARTSGTVSYPKRERAKWYLVKLPIDGRLEASLTLEPISKSADVGFEIMDSGFNVLAPKGDTDEEAGNVKKERKVPEISKGEVYLHIFTLGRNDEADYKVKLKFAPKQGSTPQTGFPNNLPNPPALAQVPTSDDSPRKPPRKKDDKPPPPKNEPKKEEPDKTAMRGTIIEFGETGNGIRITINKGSAAGLEDGWEGYIVAKTNGKALPGSSFTIKNVKNDESSGIVKVSMDDVQNNRLVVLKPPK